MTSALNRTRFVEEVLPIIMQQAAGAASAKDAGGAKSASKCPSDTATAQRMAEFASDSYNDKGAPPNAERLDLKSQGIKLDDPDSGFSSAVYRDKTNNNIVLAYRGTEQSSFSDWWTNAKQALGFNSAQYSEAAQVADQVKKQFPNDHIEITGHSLGGGLATVGAAAIGARATIFNAAGVNPATFARLGLPSSDLNNLVTNYRVEGEVLTGLQKHPGVYAGAAGGLIGAIAGGPVGALRGAEIGGSVGSKVPAASGCQVDLEARNANGEPLSSNPVTRHVMPSVQAALQYHQQQEAAGGCW